LDTEPCPKRGISVFEDRKEEGVWRVEYFDEDGGCYVTIFAGPGAERRARDYGEALKALRPGGDVGGFMPVPRSSRFPIAKAKTTIARIAIAPMTLAAVIGGAIGCLAFSSMAAMRPFGPDTQAGLAPHRGAAGLFSGRPRPLGDGR
jgi:hypothetical protein